MPKLDLGKVVPDVPIASVVDTGGIKSVLTPGYISVDQVTGIAMANGLPELFPDQIAQWKEINIIKAMLANASDGIISDVNENSFLVAFEDRIRWDLISGVFNRPNSRVECGAGV